MPLYPIFISLSPGTYTAAKSLSPYTPDILEGIAGRVLSRRILAPCLAQGSHNQASLNQVSITEFLITKPLTTRSVRLRASLRERDCAHRHNGGH